ncbi:MAG: ABC transporter substrate-binding protein [Thermoanaerobacterales bacterium]|nr:ABC transporter substrate-binding protein [Thermoanaerobacterales bacterium]
MVFRLPFRLSLGFVLLLLAGILLLAVQARREPAPPSGRIVWGLAAAPRAINPALALDDPSRRVLGNVFEGLVRFRPGSPGEIEPALARRWDVSDDGLTWTFEIRPGVRFHGGVPCDAAAVVHAIEAQRRERSPYAGFIYAPVDTVEALDERRVRFRLRYPYAPFIRNLAMLQAAVTGDPGADGIPAGTGPYQITAWTASRITLQRVPHYWGPQPRTRELRFVVIPRREQRLAELASGCIDAADDPGVAGAPTGAPYRILAAPGQNLCYMGFYTNKPPFGNPSLRRAVAEALDVSALVAEVFPDGLALPASGLLPPGILGSGGGTGPMEAAERPTPAGTASGLSFTLVTYRDARPYAPTGGTALARAVAERLAMAGIRVQVRSYPWEAFKEALRRQEGDAFLYGWVGDNGDPDNFLYNLLATSQIPCGQNISRYSNPRADLLLARAQREQDEKRRSELYRQAQQIILADTPWIPLTHGVESVALSRNLQGLATPSPGFPLGAVYRQSNR